jgi:hypothetical protein
MWPAIAFAPFDQLLDLALGEVFPCSDLAVFRSARSNFPYFGRWGHHSEVWFRHGLSCFHCNDFPYFNPKWEICKVMAQAFFGQKSFGSATTGSEV